MRGCVGLESVPAMEDEDIWCLDWHEEDLGCDRKTTIRSQISSGRMNFQVVGIIWVLGRRLAREDAKPAGFHRVSIRHSLGCAHSGW